jgi:IS5 family transposase
MRHVDLSAASRSLSQNHDFRSTSSISARSISKAIRCEMRRRAAVEPVIGSIKAEHQMSRNYLG